MGGGIHPREQLRSWSRPINTGLVSIVALHYPCGGRGESTHPPLRDLIHIDNITSDLVTPQLGPTTIYHASPPPGVDQSPGRGDRAAAFLSTTPYVIDRDRAHLESRFRLNDTPSLFPSCVCAKEDCPTLSPLLTTPKTGTLPLCPQLNILPYLSASLEPLRDRNTSSTRVLIRSRSLRPPLIPLIDTLILSVDKSVQAAQYTTRRQRGVRATATPDGSSNGPSYTRSERLE